VHQLQTVAADALASGEWTDPAVRRLRDFLTDMSASHRSPLVGYACEEALSRINQEEWSPTISAIKRHGDRGEGRLAEADERIISPSYRRAADEDIPAIDRPLERGDKVRPIAKGAYGIFDHSNVLRFYGIDANHEPGQNRKHELAMQPVDSLTSDTQINPFSRGDLKNIPLLMEHLHRPVIRDRLENDLGLNLKGLTLRSQMYFLKYLSGQDQAGFTRLRAVLHKQPSARQAIAESFLATEQDEAMSEKILALGEVASPDDARKIFSLYGALAEQAQGKSKEVIDQLARLFPGESFSFQEVYESLMVRAKNILNQAYRDGSMGNLDTDVIRGELEKESSFQEMLHAQFSKIAELLTQPDIDLGKYAKAQELILRSLEISGQNNEGLYLRALNAMGKLRPAPEIYWKVDRRAEDYNRRLGVNLPGVLRDFADESTGKKTLLEFGPGSGVAKHDLSMQGAASKYNEFSMSDAVYYDLATPIEHLIDFKKLQQDAGAELTTEERSSLIEYIKTCILVQAGGARKEKVEYDQDSLGRITRDPNALKEIMKEAGTKMQQAEMTPTSRVVELPDGPHYRQKFNVNEQSGNWQKARALLMQDTGEYIRADVNETDVYDQLNAHPTGIMLGDFSEIKSLKSGQIDVALGVRSTVYVDREQYAGFMATVCDKLRNGGIYIDDNVRENFGQYYRLAELLDLQRELSDRRSQGAVDYDISIYLVIGEGVAEEDYKKVDAPISVVIAKGRADVSAITKNLNKGSRLVPLIEVGRDQKYLKSLDKDGRIADDVRHKLAA
jgi:hypothetical protein